MRRALWAWRSHLPASIWPASRSTEYAHVRLYSQSNPKNGLQSDGSCLSKHAEVVERLNELQAPATQLYPRLGSHVGVLSCSAFNKKYASLRNGEVRQGEEVVVRGMTLKDSMLKQRLTLPGRVHSFRIAGPKLLFLDLVQEGHRVQGLCNLSKLSVIGVNSEEFRAFYHRLRRGDIFGMACPCLTQTFDPLTNIC